MQITAPAPVESLVIDPFVGQSTPVATAKALGQSEKTELFEAMLLRGEQLDVPLEHVFAHGVYMRQGKLPKGSYLIGHQHKTDHLNVLFTGKVSVIMNGSSVEITAPCVFKAEAGVRKIIYAHEDSVLANIHGTNETDLDKIEDELIIKSDTFVSHHQGAKSDLMLLAEQLEKGKLLCS
ncbi:hypothetical protein UFOVP33_7 [uncultured Caudovirales phage]|uniref:Uncharacterized protein n=1 Tax=uncultured Caudovirales phage TaxID=2100421 RepID=A0A6J5KQQ1_9CAUD|nr:hypothetical protein UFOVP33_7 [uncultured Caudovirales phage]